MWIKKSQLEIKHERKVRRTIFERYSLVLMLLVIFWAYLETGSFANILDIYKVNPEAAFYLLFYPLIIYFGYRNYVLHGRFFIERPGKVCLACEKGMGFSDDGWGFKAYGKRKKEWYQIKACNTPEKCNIVYMCEAKWVEDNEENV